MKILQNDFTTQEQSKQLLELGVPADSSNCYYDSWEQIQWRQLKDLDHDFFQKYNSYIPCWSVGRLMKIFAICFDPDFIHFDIFADGINFLKQMMDKFETYAKNMDFSKLEE